MTAQKWMDLLLCLLIISPFIQTTTAQARTEEKKMVVVAVDFTDVQHSLSIHEIEVIFKKVSLYYKESSFNLVNLSFSIYGWYKLNITMKFYGANNFAIPDDRNGDCISDTYRLVNDAITAADKDVDFSQYSDLIILHAGNGEESDLDKNDIWSICFVGTFKFRTEEKTFAKAAIVPEMERNTNGSPIGTICHEIGHLLGLPDLYSPAGDPLVGPWDVMATGNWMGDPPGSGPSGFSLWSRMKLGWVLDSFMYTATAKEKMVEVPLRFTELIPIPNAYSSIKIPVGEGLDEVFYLVEARGKIGFGTNLPSEGVIIMKYQYRILRVLDAAPQTKTLDDAVWKVGATFENENEKLYITVLEKMDGGFKVLVSRGNRPVVFAS